MYSRIFLKLKILVMEINIKYKIEKKEEVTLELPVFFKSEDLQTATYRAFFIYGGQLKEINVNFWYDEVTDEVTDYTFELEDSTKYRLSMTYGAHKKGEYEIITREQFAKGLEEGRTVHQGAKDIF
jgi:hypothetical protein